MSDTPQTATMRFDISGMHCAGCAARLQSVLRAIPEVESASVSFLSGSAEIISKRDVRSEVLRAASSCGYQATAAVGQGQVDRLRQRDTEAQSLRNSWRWRAIVGISLWLPLEFTHHFGHSYLNHRQVMMILGIGATVAIIGVGWGIFASAWRALLRGSTNMDSLVALGAVSGWGLSVWLSISGASQGYFAEIVALLSVVSLGHWLESRGVRDASAAVHALLALKPETAELLSDGGALRVVQVNQVRVGDRVMVRPGARIPIDGVVQSGAAGLDLSALTGEFLPVRAGPGTVVTAGAIALDGSVVVTATSEGGETSLERIAEMVLAAQATKAPISKLADRVCAIFVPAVIVIALSTLVGWSIAGDWQRGLLAAITVLVISCPCALGIATPLAIVVGTGECARRGILVSSAEVLEQAACVRRAFLDKTGTLTKGSPVIKSFDVEPGAPRGVLSLASALESRSEHPIAKAIVAHAEMGGVHGDDTAESFTVEPGMGVRGRVRGLDVAVVRDPDASARVEVAGVLAARFVCADEIRAGAPELVQSMRRMGIRPTMLTGDRRSAAVAVAGEIGLREDEVLADLTPQAKLQIVEAAGGSSLMVGDGINDGAALSAATVGVAMGSGTEVARAASSVTLVHGSPWQIPLLIDISRRTVKTIRQNLWLAFVYNALAIPLAAAGLLGEHGPLVAATSMALSDVCVVGNTLRLRRSLRGLVQGTVPTP